MVPYNVPLLYRLPWQMPAYPTLPHTRFESEINEPGLPRPRRVFVVAASERTNDLAKAPSLPPFYVPEVEGKGQSSQIFRENAHEVHCRSLNKTTATTPSLRIPARAIKETINSFSPRPSKRARRLQGECKKEPRRRQKKCRCHEKWGGFEDFSSDTRSKFAFLKCFFIAAMNLLHLQSNLAPFDCERHDDTKPS